MNRSIVYGLGIVLVLLFGGFLLLQGNSRGHYTDVHSPHAALIESNLSFAQGESSYKQGDYGMAIAEYTKALSSADDLSQESQVKIKIGNAHREAGEIPEAIAIYKDIVANPRYPDVMRAYGVENIGRIYYQYPFARDEIRRLTFSEEPYRSFAADGADDELAYRRLFEYALTFRALGGSAARVANWYANEAVRVQKIGGSQDEISAAVTKSNEYVRIAETDLERIAVDPNERAAAPEILFRLGRTLAELSRLNVANLTDAEAHFKRAYEIAVPMGPRSDGFARYQYAAFLQEFFGSDRVDDIVKIVAAFSENRSAYVKTSVFGTFRAAAKETSATHNRLAGIALIDPIFKDTLESIGWETDDFVAR